MKQRKLLSWLLRLLVSGLLLYWLFRKGDVQAAVAKLPPHTLQVVALAVALYACCQMLNAFRWWLLLRLTGHSLPYRAAVRLTYIGMFANFFLPTSVGGDLVRVGLAAPHGVPVSTGLLTVFLQRFTGLLALLVFGLVGVLAGAAAQDQRPTATLLFCAGLSLAGLAAMAVATVAERRWQLGDRLPKVLGRPVRKLGAAVRLLAGSPQGIAAVLATAVLYQLCMVGLQALLGTTAGVRPAAVNWFWTVPMMTLGEMVPLPAGLGAREATAQGVFAGLGFGNEAVLASLLWQATKLLTSLPGGLLLLVSGPLPPDPEVVS